MDSKLKFINALRAIAEMHDKTISDNLMALWFSAIASAGMTIEQATEGLQRHTNDPENGRFMPTPAHIVGQFTPKKADIEAEALIEFHNMKQGIFKAGIYNDAVFSNHKTNMAISVLGGWRAVCMAEDWDEYIGQKRFIDAYKAVSLKPIPMRLPLNGIADSRNLYKFGRTPEEKSMCDRLLEDHAFGELPPLADNLPKLGVKEL